MESSGVGAGVDPPGPPKVRRRNPGYWTSSRFTRSPFTHVLAYLAQGGRPTGSSDNMACASASSSHSGAVSALRKRATGTS